MRPPLISNQGRLAAPASLRAGIIGAGRRSHKCRRVAQALDLEVLDPGHRGAVAVAVDDGPLLIAQFAHPAELQAMVRKRLLILAKAAAPYSRSSGE